MKLIDVNLLVFTVNTDAPQHQSARDWWAAVLSSTEEIAVPWATLLGFLRIVTNPKIFPKPLSIEEAIAYVSAWLRQPCVRILHTRAEHWDKLQQMLRTSGGGNNVPDAHLATLAVIHDAVLHTNDAGFARFPGVRTVNPLSAASRAV